MKDSYADIMEDSLKNLVFILVASINFQEEKSLSILCKIILDVRLGKVGTNGRIKVGTNGRIKVGTNGRIKVGTNGRIKAEEHFTQGTLSS